VSSVLGAPDPKTFSCVDYSLGKTSGPIPKDIRSHTVGNVLKTLVRLVDKFILSQVVVRSGTSLGGERLFQTGTLLRLHGVYLIAE
jgi:hypothetical protein